MTTPPPPALHPGVTAVALGGVGRYVTRTLFDADDFASRAASSLRDPRVSAFVATEISDAAIRQRPDLIAVRPLLVGVSEGIVSSEAGSALARTRRPLRPSRPPLGGRPRRPPLDPRRGHPPPERAGLREPAAGGQGAQAHLRARSLTLEDPGGTNGGHGRARGPAPGARLLVADHPGIPPPAGWHPARPVAARGRDLRRRRLRRREPRGPSRFTRSGGGRWRRARSRPSARSSTASGTRSWVDCAEVRWPWPGSASSWPPPAPHFSSGSTPGGPSRRPGAGSRALRAGPEPGSCARCSRSPSAWRAFGGPSRS